MQLIYRGQTYEYTPHSSIPSSRKPCAINSTVKDGAVKMIYRGQAYEYTPNPVIPSSHQSCAINSTVKDGAVKLVYWGQAYEYMLPPIQPYRTPRAINWRFQMAMEGEGESSERVRIESGAKAPCLER